MTNHAREFLSAAWSALGGPAELLNAARFSGDGGLRSAFAVTDFASATIGAAALAMAELAQCRGGRFPDVTIDRRLASFWFGLSIRPAGWKMPAPWDPVAGDYQCTDGWIKLHTNAPHHRAAAGQVLGHHADKAAMAGAVAGWAKQELESAIVAAGGCAAEMRSVAEWAVHPQGRALAGEPLAHMESFAPRHCRIAARHPRAHWRACGCWI